ncbi:MAG: Holliday junction resolvase RuvX [Clostridia bacterium]|nr:Holliday junction resolvase RuvX [Clostridia bacterium]
MHMNERIVCLDIGDVRIGVAVSDPTGTIASPVEVITRVGWGPDTQKIRSVCERYNTDRILSGLPLNMDGSEGFQARKVRDFCAQLEKAGLNVIFQDERLSTVSAEEALIEGGVSRSDRRKTVDKVAASVILQQWLDAQNHKEVSP